MKLILVILATTIWIASMTISTAVAETINSAKIDPALLQSEEEIWEYFEKLCEEVPTQRCESMQFLRVRDGETVSMESYNEEDAYRGKDEIIDAARAIRDQRLSDQDG